MIRLYSCTSKPGWHNSVGLIARHVLPRQIQADIPVYAARPTRSSPIRSRAKATDALLACSKFCGSFILFRHLQSVRSIKVLIAEVILNIPRSSAHCWTDCWPPLRQGGLIGHVCACERVLLCAPTDNASCGIEREAGVWWRRPRMRDRGM